MQTRLGCFERRNQGGIDHRIQFFLITLPIVPVEKTQAAPIAAQVGSILRIDIAERQIDLVITRCGSQSSKQIISSLKMQRSNPQAHLAFQGKLDNLRNQLAIWTSFRITKPQIGWQCWCIRWRRGRRDCRRSGRRCGSSDRSTCGWRCRG